MQIIILHQPFISSFIFFSQFSVQRQFDMEKFFNCKTMEINGLQFCCSLVGGSPFTCEPLKEVDRVDSTSSQLRQMCTRDKRLNIHYGTFILSGLWFLYSLVEQCFLYYWKPTVASRYINKILEEKSGGNAFINALSQPMNNKSGENSFTMTAFMANHQQLTKMVISNL